MSDVYLFRNSVRDLLRPRKLLTILILMALPGGLALLWHALAPAGRYHTGEVYDQIAEAVGYGFILVIGSVFFSTNVIAQEIEQNTIGYLLTRPVPRWRILFAKFLAALLATTICVWLSLILLALVTYGPGSLSGSRLGRDLLIAPVGVLAYSTLFLLLATLIHRALVWGLAFAFGWEVLVSVLSGYFQRLSLMSYLRVLAPHSKQEAENVDMNQIITATTQMPITSHLAWTVLITVAVLALVASLVIFSIREYVPRGDAE